MMHRRCFGENVVKVIEISKVCSVCISRYNSCLGESQKAGEKKGLNSGAAFGLFQLVTFGCYALAFW